MLLLNTLPTQVSLIYVKHLERFAKWPDASTSIDLYQFGVARDLRHSHICFIQGQDMFTLAPVHAPVHVSMCQHPAWAFLRSIIDRYHTTQAKAALSRVSPPDKASSLCNRKHDGPGLSVAINLVVTQTPGAPSEVNTDDSSIMFGAVTVRLMTLFAEEDLTVSREVQDSQKTDRLRQGVLECVSALEHLRTAMTHELAAGQTPASEVSP